MDLRDIMAAPTGVQRPEHPDFWALSEIILAMKADMEEFTPPRVSLEEQERKWRSHYEALGDFDSIAYCAIQAGLEVHGIKTGADWHALNRSEHGRLGYIQSVQTYFDGFLMGARFAQVRASRGSAVEAWLKEQRDAFDPTRFSSSAAEQAWNTLDRVLDDYRLHADTGTPLDLAVNEEGS